MKRIGFLMACSALALVLGCDNRTNAPMDSGGITLMDSGPDEDAGPPDSGSMPTTCEVTVSGGFPPLPASCLPRCQASTLSCLQGCGTDESCANGCLAADETPSVSLVVNGMAQPGAFDCSQCLDWQFTSCVADACPTELAAYASCVQMNPSNYMTACATQGTALDTCQMDNQTAINGCASSRLVMCAS